MLHAVARPRIGGPRRSLWVRMRRLLWSCVRIVVVALAGVGPAPPPPPLPAPPPIVQQESGAPKSVTRRR